MQSITHPSNNLCFASAPKMAITEVCQEFGKQRPGMTHGFGRALSFLHASISPALNGDN